MTIEYKDSKRIVGLSTDITNTPTYEDDFSGTDDWADQGSGVGVNTTTDRLEFSSWTDNTTNNSSTLDLGSALSDSKWTIRFKLQWTGFSNTTDWTAPAIGMFSADSSTGGNSAQDMLFYWGIANGATKASYLSSADNSTVSGTDTNLNYAWVLDTTYYIELQRDGSNFSATIWTGSYNGTEVASGTDTIGGTVSGLRYFGAKTPVTNRGGSFTGWLDDLQIWNGILATSLSSKPTDVQDNSILIEQDTASRYWFSEATARTYETDFSSSTGWTTAGSGVSVDTVGETLDFNCVNGTNNGTSYDLQNDLGSGVFLDSEKWLFRCKLVITTSTEHSDPAVNLEIGVSDSDKDTSFSSNRDGIGLQFSQSDGSSAGWYATEPDGTSWNSAKTKFAYQDANIQTGTYYIEIRRLSATSAEVRVSLDNFATYQETESLTISSTLDQLRYLIVQDRNDGSGTGNKLIGTIDDMKFYNGITSTTPATWINEFGVSDGLMFGGVSTSSYANFSDSQSWNGVSWTAGGSLTGARQRGASAGTGSTSARYVNGYNSTPAPYPNSNRNESYNGTAWTSDTVHPQSVNNKSNGGCGTVDSMIVTGGHQNGTGDVNNYYKWTGSWTSIAQGITGSGGSISGTLTSALMTKSTSAQTWNGSSWTSSTATSTSRTFSPASGTSSTSGFRVFGTYANPFISTSESWNGTAWTARGSAPAGRVEAGCIPASTDSMMTLGGQQYHGASGSDIYSTDVYEYRKGTFTTGASFNNGRRSSGGAGS